MGKWVKIRNKLLKTLSKWLGFGKNKHLGHDRVDDVPLGKLDFCYGGTKGNSAVLDGVARISDLKIHSDRLTFSWKSGGCENIGAKGPDDYKNTFACLFCRINGQWKGGKFDEISTSRLHRDFKNIRGGYRGWDPKAIEKADGFAFMIISKDGRRRTNIISC